MSRLRSWIRDRVGGRAGLRRAAALTWTCLASAFLLTDYEGEVAPAWPVGEVADRDVAAPAEFPFVDAAATHARQAEAEAAVSPVFEADLTVAKRIENRVSQAFDMARRRASGVEDDAARATLARDFVAALEVGVDSADLRTLQDAAWSREIEDLTVELIEVAMRRPVVQDRSVLPTPSRPITVVDTLGEDREERTVEDYAELRTLEEARQAVSLHVVERFPSSRRAEAVAVAANLARAAVRPNVQAAPLLTEERLRAARDAVGTVEVVVRKGTRIIRAGDVVTPQQRAVLDTLASSQGSTGGRFLFGTWLAFAAVLTVSAVSFARGTMRKFAWRPHDLEAMGLALVLVLAIGRLMSGASSLVSAQGDELALALALLAPVGGGAMAVRILVNSESALVWALVTSLLVAARQDASALLAAYYIVTALAAAGGVGQARERLAVLRSGLQSGLIGAGMVLLLVLVRAHASGAGEGLPDIHGVAVLWGAALVSGVIGACFTLGIIPAFELVGFTTDYKLLELSNLNHPLLRQLMLRAPGTYHHSVIVGSLSEAACEAIGANALLARVACYFHDIGKGLKPQYFVENQREAGNKHDRLTPLHSAQVIINHVRDGAALAVQYKLPRPVADQIFMHHGTGLIHYFHEKAKEQAEGAPVDEAQFRYPGPKPDSREAGIIMLADKVEAACRTIREPSEPRIRAMIQQIINSVMSDGQFESCPLTLRELYQIADAFTMVLLGIYHHRIEYPATAGISQSRGRFVPVPKQGTITLEIVNPITRPASASPVTGGTPGPPTPVDYESADQLPGGRTPTLPPYDDS